MGLADELGKLQALHESRILSEEEFAQAKAALLNNSPHESSERVSTPQKSDALGQAAKLFVCF